MLELGLKFTAAYWLGSLMGGLIVGRFKGNVDLRRAGSGNVGGTNALRTQGAWFALGVMIIDVGKGMVGAGLVPQLALPVVGDDPALSRTWLQLSCAAAAVIGHVWPLWHGFRGGKGAATLVGTLAVLQPYLLIPVLLVWAWVLALSGFVGLATMCAGVFAPAYLAVTRLPEQQPLFIFTAVMALYVIYAHRSNIRHMLDGTEHRHTRIMMFKKGRK